MTWIPSGSRRFKTLTGDRAVFPGHVSRVSQECLGKHASDARLKLVGRRVESATKLGEQLGRKVAEGPVVVDFRAVAQLLAHHAARDGGDQLVQLNRNAN